MYIYATERWSLLKSELKKVYNLVRERPGDIGGVTEREKIQGDTDGHVEGGRAEKLE